jgi:hypothetical protein
MAHHAFTRADILIIRFFYLSKTRVVETGVVASGLTNLNSPRSGPSLGR